MRLAIAENILEDAIAATHRSLTPDVLRLLGERPETTLGVPVGASQSEIKKAYREKAMAAHPDHGGSDEEMTKINDAYTRLIARG